LTQIAKNKFIAEKWYNKILKEVAEIAETIYYRLW